jgi:hypothetical protein
VVSEVKNQMIIEAYGDFVRVKHVVRMRQVNPNKASKEKTTIICFNIIKTMHDFFQRLIKQSQSFETSHATSKTTKHTTKMTSSMACKSLSRSLNKLPFCTTFGMKLFLSFPTPFNPF